MGISCIGVYESRQDRYRMFLGDNMDQVIALFRDTIKGGGIIVAFNSFNFDNKLVVANLDISEGFLKPEYHYDILREIWISKSLDPDVFNFETHGGYGLDAVCEETIGTRKTGHGAHAPVDWQRGNIGAVIDYCLMDVWNETELFKFILKYGFIRSPKAPYNKIFLRHPSER